MSTENSTCDQRHGCARNLARHPKMLAEEDQMEAGLGIWLDRPVTESVELAVAAEIAGFADIWLPDHYFLRDVYVAQAIMAQRTRKIRLGTAVSAALLRHPALLASSTATIHELSGGRAILGVGTGGFEFSTQLGLKPDSPLAVVRDAVEIARQLFVGTAEVRGKAFTATGAALGWTTGEVPIYVAARGPRMLELAGEIADGVITHGLAPQHLEFVIERVTAGETRAGRDPGACEVCVMLDVDIDDNESAAIDRLRPECTTTAGGAYAEELIPLYGLNPKDVAPLRYAVRAGDPNATKLVTDEMVHAFAIGGTEQTVSRRLAELKRAGIRRVILKVAAEQTLDEAVSVVQRLGLVLEGLDIENP